MHILNSLLLLTSSVCAVLAADQKYSKSVKLSYEFVGSKSSAKPLAEVLYEPTTFKYHLSSWTPPSVDGLKSTTPEPTSTKLVRVLLPDGSSTITSLGAFDPSLSQNIDLWLSAGPDGSVFSASISSISPPPLSEEEQRQKRKEERARAKGKPIPKPKPQPKSKKDKLVTEEVQRPGPVVKVNLLRAAEGPQPKLLSRKPPQVDSEGREIPQEEVPEKSFFQKYWWVFLAGTVLLMSGGGGEK